jgi:hypothetical protein
MGAAAFSCGMDCRGSFGGSEPLVDLGSDLGVATGEVVAAVHLHGRSIASRDFFARRVRVVLAVETQIRGPCKSKRQEGETSQME